MKPLVRTLAQSTPGRCSDELIRRHFAALTLRDLGYYICESNLRHLSRDVGHSAADYAFLLEGALAHTMPHGPTASGDLAHRGASETALLQRAIGSSTLYENGVVSLCWFVIPPGQALPLHDHPGMTVWQRVMFGSLHVCSLDWVDEGDDDDDDDATTMATGRGALSRARTRAQRGGTGVVRQCGEVHGVSSSVSGDEVLRFCASGGGGVLHALANLHPTLPVLFVDIITPPYMREPDNIACTYFDVWTMGKACPVALRDMHYRQHADTDAVAGGSRLAVGDIVELKPRRHYHGPAMTGFVHLPNWDEDTCALAHS